MEIVFDKIPCRKLSKEKELFIEDETFISDMKKLLDDKAVKKGLGCVIPSSYVFCYYKRLQQGKT